MSSPALKSLKVLVVGLDGGSWNSIEPLARAGRLPNLARLMGGVRGPLASTIPPVTPPAWTSFMTGKNPGKHGLYHFVEPEPGSYGMRFTNARSRKARTLWSLLNEAGRRTGVVNVPMTFPPEPVDGFMVSGMDTPSEASDFIYPSRLVPEIRKHVGPVKLDLRYLGFMHDDARRLQTLRELHDVDEQRLRMILHLLDREPVETFMVVYGSPDTSQHYFWHYVDRSHFRYDLVGAGTFGTAIEDVYVRLDRHIGALMERVADDGLTMIVSDHGFGPTSSKIIYLNRFLAELGLLAYRRDGRAEARRLLSSVVRGMDRVVRGALTSGQKRTLAGMFPKLRVGWEQSRTDFDTIDWSKTKAYCSEVLTSPASVWINVKGRQPQGIVDPGGEYREVVEYITERLLGLKDPATGGPLVQRVVKKEEAYHGPYLDMAPDLLLAWWEGEGFMAKPSRPEDRGKPVIAEAPAAFGDRAEWSGEHRFEGVLAVRGAGIRPGETVTGARIIDMAPTILHFLGQSVPDDMDGRVLTEIFDEEFLRRRPVSRGAAAGSAESDEPDTYSDEEAEMIKKRLQDLGYVD
jgi:predicted AlkP superfamily phosphohydrolase/phosphomutase